MKELLDAHMVKQMSQISHYHKDNHPSVEGRRNSSVNANDIDGSASTSGSATSFLATSGSSGSKFKPSEVNLQTLHEAYQFLTAKYVEMVPDENPLSPKDNDQDKPQTPTTPLQSLGINDEDPMPLKSKLMRDVFNFKVPNPLEEAKLKAQESIDQDEDMQRLFAISDDLNSDFMKEVKKLEGGGSVQTQKDQGLLLPRDEDQGSMDRFGLSPRRSMRKKKEYSKSNLGSRQTGDQRLSNRRGSHF